MVSNWRAAGGSGGVNFFPMVGSLGQNGFFSYGRVAATYRRWDGWRRWPVWFVTIFGKPMTKN